MQSELNGCKYSNFSNTPDAEADDKNVSCMILFEDSLPVTVATFSVTITTNRCFVDLHVIYTKKMYRRRGHASTAFAILKEFACCNPSKSNCEGKIENGSARAICAEASPPYPAAFFLFFF